MGLACIDAAQILAGALFAAAGGVGVPETTAEGGSWWPFFVLAPAAVLWYVSLRWMVRRETEQLRNRLSEAEEESRRLKAVSETSTGSSEPEEDKGNSGFWRTTFNKD